MATRVLETPQEQFNAQTGEEADQVLIVLRQIIHAIDVQSKKLAKETGLSTPQLVVLKAVEDLGEVTTKAVSDEVSLSQPTVTAILDRLEKQGLVERHRSTKDRRIVHPKLTDAGRDMLTKAPPLLQETFVGAFSGLPKKRRKEILAALNDVARMMRADDFDASPVLTISSPKSSA